MTIEEQYFFLVDTYSAKLARQYPMLEIQEVRSFIGYKFLMERNSWKDKVNKNFLKLWANRRTVDYIRRHFITRANKNKTFFSLDGMNNAGFKNDNSSNYTFARLMTDWNGPTPLEALEYKEDLKQIRKAAERFLKEKSQSNTVSKQAKLEILELREEGMKLVDIGEIYGICDSRICQIVKETAQRLRKEVENDLDHLGNFTYIKENGNKPVLV